jgi:hypothetical protein
MSLRTPSSPAGPKLNATEKDHFIWKNIATRFLVLGFVSGVGVWCLFRRRAGFGFGAKSRLRDAPSLGLCEGTDLETSLASR